MRSNRCTIFETIRNKREGHTMRDPEGDKTHYEKVTRYIECNPVKAGLVKAPEQWPFSSARFRDENNRLAPPPKA